MKEVLKSIEGRIRVIRTYTLGIGEVHKGEGEQEKEETEEEEEEEDLEEKEEEEEETYLPVGTGRKKVTFCFALGSKKTAAKSV